MPRTQILTGGRGEHRWEVATRPCPPAIAGCVRSLFGYVERTPGLCRRHELPAAQVVAIIEFEPGVRVVEPGGPRVYRHGFVGGVDDSFTITEHDGLQAGIQLNLTPIGAWRLFGMPMSELAKQVVPLEDLLEPGLGERLAELDWSGRLDVVEAMVAKRLRAVDTRARAVQWAYDRLHGSGGELQADALARELGYSHKHVITLFREYIGVPPRTVARLARFDQLVKRLRSGDGPSWAELAVMCGYYDQAHLANDVRRMAGLTPTELRIQIGTNVPEGPDDGESLPAVGSSDEDGEASHRRQEVAGQRAGSR